jgi:Spy/CpxP family protein refolding chaperone
MGFISEPNHMLSKKILIPLTALLLSAPIVLADSGSRTASNQKMLGAGMLNLTEEQKTELRELTKTQREVLRDNLLALRAAGARLRIAFQSSDSEEGIRTQAVALSALKAQIDAARLEQWIAVWRILTPDQRLLMPQQSHWSAIAPGYRKGKETNHRAFWDRKRGKGWGGKHSMKWQKPNASKWRKNQQNSDTKREY